MCPDYQPGYTVGFAEIGSEKLEGDYSGNSKKSAVPYEFTNSLLQTTFM